MNRSLEVEVKVGIFVAIGIGLIAAAILLVGGNKAIFSLTMNYHVVFDQVDGIIPGSIVKVAGVRVGQVEKIKFLPGSGKIDVAFTVRKEYEDAIRGDSTVSVRTQGVLGDKILVISTGNPALAKMDQGSELKAETGKELKDYLSSADEVLDRLKNSLGHIETILGNFTKESRSEIFFRNMSQMSTNVNASTSDLPKKINDLYGTMNHMKSIMSKIDHGDGTIGALVNDPSLYEDLKSLLGGANRNKVLKYFVRKSVEESREANAEAEKARTKKK